MFLLLGPQPRLKCRLPSFFRPPSANYMPRFLLSPLLALSHTILTKTLAGRGYYHPRLTGAAT